MSTTTPPHTHVHVHQLTPYPIPEEEDANAFPFPTLPIPSASSSASTYTASSQQRVQAPSPWTMKHGFSFSSPPVTPARPLAFTRSSVGTGMGMSTGMGSLKQRPHATSHPSAHFALQPPQSPSEGGKIPPGLLLKRRSSVCSTASTTSTGSSVGTQESLMSEKSWGNWEVGPVSPPSMSSATTTTTTTTPATRPELRERRRGSERSDISDGPDEILITPQTDLFHSFEEDGEMPLSAKDGFRFGSSSFGKNKMDLVHPTSNSISQIAGKRLFPPIETLFEEDEEPPILTVGLVRVGGLGRGRLFEASDRVIRLNPARSPTTTTAMMMTPTTMTPTATGTATATIPKRPTFKRKITPRPGLTPLPPTTRNRFGPKHQDFEGFITEESEAESQSEEELAINDDPNEREEYKRGRSPTRRPALGGDGRTFSSVLERGRVWVSL